MWIMLRVRSFFTSNNPIFNPISKSHVKHRFATIPRIHATLLSTLDSSNPFSPSLPLQAKTKIRIVCARAYHCLFMHNMLIRPTEDELANFGNPDFTIFNAGAFPCNRYTSYMTSSSSVDIDLGSKEMVRSIALYPEP